MQMANSKWHSVKPISHLRLLISGLCAARFALSFPVGAQQPAKISRIAFVSSTGSPNNPGANVEAFRQGMRELGYVEGKNIQVEYRYIEGKSERTPSLVSELIQLKVDVLISAALSATRVAKKETQKIPIVFNIPDDPVAVGLVESLARPGGNITGVARLGRELSGKRLGLLTEAIPGIKRVVILYSPTNILTTSSRRNYEDYEAPARALKITPQLIHVRNPSQDLDGAIREAVKGNLNGLIIIDTTPLFPYREKIVELAFKHRLPLLAETTIWVEAGGLMSYSANEPESYRRIATYVDKVLKGTKPADLPVEQPTKFEFVINLKTASALNLTIPQSVLYRADRVIR